MSTVDEMSPERKAVPMPIWARIVIAVGGATLCIVAAGAAITGGLSDMKCIMRVVVCLSFGLGLVVAAIAGRWPNLNLASLLP